MKIAICADSTCDIPKELVDKYNITITPITVIMGDKEFFEGINITSQDIYDFVEKNNMLPKTAAKSTYEYKKVFEELRKNNNAVIHLALSSGVSSTINNAIAAAKELDNVFVIDTKSLSSGSGLLVLSCVDKIKKKMEPEKIVEELKQETEKVQASFIISKLAYLRKGGRCSTIELLGANLLGIKITVQLVDGKMRATKKYTGKLSNCLSKYLKDIVNENPPDLNRVFVTSSSKMPGIKEKLVKEVKALGFKEVIVADAGATICCHCGPNTIGVLYMKK
ncbi:MAG: DegV family protein [Clostridia bacterium]|nr:DegV family protein [Clostridia bacterium]MDD3862228.1 DegV family protein [Clostridia bacterium]MDD4408915.1 DegV family protein [Clostridia bacterium]